MQKTEKTDAQYSMGTFGANQAPVILSSTGRLSHDINSEDCAHKASFSGSNSLVTSLKD